MKYIVYQTINKENKFIYIGVHKIETDKFDGYIGCGVYINRSATYMNPKTPFQCAVKRYGTSAFIRTTLYEFNTAKEAYKKEEEIVTKDFVNRDDTYNVALGGFGGGLYEYEIPIYQFDLNGNLVKEWNNIADARDFFNCTTYAFYTAMQFKESLYNYFWSRESSILIENYSKGDQKKPVYKYATSGKCLAIYSSITEAAKLENIDRTTLSTNIRLQSLVGNKYYFSDTLYDRLVIKPKKSLRGQTYYIYSLEGNYINSFKSKELMDFFKTRSWNTIYRAVHAQNGIYKDWQIKTEYLGDKIDKVEPKSRAKSVLVYRETGELVGEYDSIQKAVKATNSKLSGVNRVLRGLQHTTNSLIFKYKE